MSNETKKTALPKLRFPEFEEAEEWEILPLGRLIEGVSKRNRDKKINRVFTNSAVSGIVDQRDFFDKDIATKGKTDNYTVVEFGDYVYNPRISEHAPVGPTSRNKLGEGIVSPLYTVFRFRDSNNEFYEHYFKSISWQKSLKTIGNMGARHDRMGISLTQLRLVEVSFPSLQEQQKIATTLSALDDLITAQSVELDTLQAHKWGLMQGLFPTEGETVPKLRFPEFQDAEEWTEKTLGNIMVEGRLGSNFQSSDGDCGIPVIKMSNLSRGRINLDKVEFLAEDGAYNESDLLKAGDLLFNTRNSLELVGKVAIWNNELAAAVYNTNLLRIVFDDKVVSSNYFMNYLFNTQGVLEKLRSIATGTTSVAAIYGKDLNKLVINIPPPNEQQRIADCLSSLDDRITAQIQKIEVLKLHKKGLMQNLFPAAPEPTS